MNKAMPLVLRNHGFNVAEYVETEERKMGGLSAKEYKKKMEEEKKELSQKLDDVVGEYIYSNFPYWFREWEETSHQGKG